MTRQGWLVAIVLGWGASAGAGELVLENGSHLDGELADEVLVLSTPAGPVEVEAGDVVRLSREGAWLRDGRVVRGTLVEGSPVKARTSLGELAIRPDELRLYQGSPRGAPGPGPVPISARVAEGAVTSTAAEAAPVAGNPLPALASYQDPASTAPRPGAPGAPSDSGGYTSVSSMSREGVRWLEVIADSALLRDAFAAAGRVGRVARGQQVMLLDYIDRRLRILNTLVLDGGYWIKVRVPDGREGWIPADTVREAR